jgi:hypothetical protein
MSARLSVLVLALGSALAAPPLPAPCQPFSTKGGQPVECALELYAGQTYVLYTDCPSVKGDTSLTLRDPGGVDVAFNDGFPFCPGDSSASLVEFYVECGLYGATSTKFSLLQDCFEDTECSGTVVVEYSGKEEPVDCTRGPFVCTKQDAMCEVLGDLYYAVGGEGWLVATGWRDAAAGIASDVCSFAGVTCTPDRLMLETLDLASNNLRGSLPDSLGTLVDLVTLRLSQNDLSGTLPAALGSLTNLAELRLTENSFSGVLPESLSNCVRLTAFYGDKVPFSGTIPEAYSRLTMLRILYLCDGSQQSGALPETLGRLTNLHAFSCMNAQLTGSLPASIVSLTNLQTLYAPAIERALGALF